MRYRENKMNSVDKKLTYVDPIDTFYGVLNGAWVEICQAHDVSPDDLPEIHYLFHSADIDDPLQAAKTIISNMLVCVSELVHRFSEWYKKPARAFGLISLRDPETHHALWTLAPEAEEKWSSHIAKIADDFKYKRGLIEAILLIDDLAEYTFPTDDRVLAACECDPPKELIVRQSFIEKEGIICNCCYQPFIPIK